MTNLPNWITATATVATALLTGTGGIAAWLALSRERRKEMPIIERSYGWVDDHLQLTIVVRNRLPEAITFDSIEILRPRLMTITTEWGPGDGYGNPGPPLKGDAPKKDCGYQIYPLGSQRTPVSTGDVGRYSFELWPPDSWASGEVRIAVRISSKADTIRNRRLVMTNRVAALPSKQSD